MISLFPYPETTLLPSTASYLFWSAAAAWFPPTWRAQYCTEQGTVLASYGPSSAWSILYKENLPGVRHQFRESQI